MIWLDPKCLHIHSHLDLKSLSFSTESTNVLLPTPWSFLTVVPRVRRPPRDTVSRCRGLTSARGKSGAQLPRVDEYWHRSTCVVRTNVSPDKSSATRCNHNSTTRMLSPSEYLVPLYSSHWRTCNSNFFSSQLMLPGTIPRLQIQKCLVRMIVSSSVDHTSRACTYPYASGLVFFSSLTTISATLFSRFRIPVDDVTVNWSSDQAVWLVRVQSVKRDLDNLTGIQVLNLTHQSMSYTNN